MGKEDEAQKKGQSDRSKNVTCPECHGMEEFTVIDERGRYSTVKCDNCDGKGELSG